MPNASFLEVRNLSVDFVTYKATTRALTDVSFTVRAGEMMGIVGETGSGKTVLQRAILGRLPLSGRIAGGEILLEDTDLLKLSEDQLRARRGRQIGLVPPGGREVLNPLIPVGVQIANVIRAHRDVPKREAASEAISLLERVAIPDPRARARAYPHELSAGMAQRVLIALAIANSPTLVLADEPTAALDVTIQLQVLELFAALVERQQSSAIVATRDLGIVAHFCQRVAVMRHGMIYEIAPVAKFFQDARHPYSQALVAAAQASRGETAMGDKTRSLLTRGERADAENGERAHALEQVDEDHYVRQDF